MITLAAPAPTPTFTERSLLWAGWWPERLASLIAIAGVLISIFLGFHVHTWQQSGSDFKTMYGSAVAFSHGQSAYSVPNISAVFDRNAIAQPLNWYGHAAVYPPFTIALLTPIVALRMDLAVYAWVIFSAVVFALALASLARFAGEHFGLTRPWRLLLIAVAAASPMLSFALEMGNVSVIVSALCLLALVLPEEENVWGRVSALALALLLKPHLALWVALAMLFMEPRRCRDVAGRALGITAAAVAGLAAWLTMHHTLGVQVGGYLATLRSEVAGGSMDAARHDLVAVSAHITSLDSLTGYWTQNLHFLNVALLIVSFIALISASIRLRSADASLQLSLVCAWTCFGLLATYHRAHDGIILLALLPWALATLRQSWYAALPWIVFALVFIMSAGPRWETWQWLATKPVIGPLAELMLYRQAPIAVLLLTAILFYQVLRAVRVPIADGTAADPLRPIRV